MSAVLEPVGHDAIRAMLRDYAAERARDAGAALHHAWLFAGPAGVGKFMVARWWASLLKCAHGGACDPLCESCRLVAGAVHPDVLEVRPVPKDKDAHEVVGVEIERKKSVGVDESRAIVRRLSLRPTRPGPRVAIVREAASMTPEAQNALLKILEEPPGSAVIVLVADNVGAMLATVRSRCRHLAFGELADAEVARALLRLGWSQDDANAAAACARGSVARAVAFDGAGLAAREELLLAWESLREHPAGIESVVQALVARKSEGYALGELFEWQLAKIRTSLGRDVHEPSGPLARVLAQSRSSDTRALVGEAERIKGTIDAIARNANARLVIRDLLMHVRS